MNIKNTPHIVLGTAEYGTAIDDKTAFSQLDLFFEYGACILDTARVYAQWLKNGDGASEKCIGKWIKKRNCRDKIIISDKGGHPHLTDMNISRLKAEDIKKDLDESLRFLQTDYIDIYFLHRDDNKTPVSEIIDYLHEAVIEGKIRYIGASNWSIKRICEANAYAKRTGKTAFTYSQIGWSYADINNDATLDKTMIYMTEQECKEYEQNSIEIMAYNSQAKGFFSKYENNMLDENMVRRYLSNVNITRYKKVCEIAKLRNATVSQIALAALLNNALKPFAIISSKNNEHLTESLGAINISLSQAEMSYLWGT